MPNIDLVSEDEARAIILQWGILHDRQAGLSWFLPIIASEAFYMRFGETSWIGYADFERHQIVKRKFFDELHSYSTILVSVQRPATTAKTVMLWTCRHRPEGSPTSELLKARLEHTWEFRRCPSTGRPYMQGHVVDRFEYLDGFRPLADPSTARSDDPHLDPRWPTTGAPAGATGDD
ncbi:hypothetical protein KBZ20_09050 [Vulcanococcus limneticus Candia 3F8]|uniref:hypothetical protein n=1 Tax=Vulcanococcus limneticus TaxID=2170428 RepID=UPI000B988957|nr:hypothetical protein [Vulcanococcus limneticus]MCP9792112.1 hypothetical protein [Vulcanococcus limneticus MW73D5]MCP9893919.1 hypothetical protein [Vulcanococcus limneticus Candia 3F8]MCP9897474.1 hypothetical protein [Vulcanococcus limneticus Candia 3B3]